MIKSVTIDDVASYRSSQKFKDLAEFNFVFGSNGTGKTTISRVIAKEESFSSCKVEWSGGVKLEPLVYNHDFVENNFNQSPELPGIFTLGDENAETLKLLATAKQELGGLTNQLQTYERTLRGENGTSGKEQELATINTQFHNDCWVQKRNYEEKFQGAFKGSISSAAKFAERILKESESISTVPLQTLADLDTKAATVFGPAPIHENSIASIKTADLAVHELNPILSKVVLGNANIDIAAMITRLGNSDWVREGRSFLKLNEGACPFCQQKTKETFVKSLVEYFDESFEQDSQAIETLLLRYKSDTDKIAQQVKSLIDSPSKFLNIDELKSAKELLDAKVTINIQRIAKKKDEPSQIVELETVVPVLETITAVIGTANGLISQHNQTINNLASERLSLIAGMWKFLIKQELQDTLKNFQTNRNNLNNAITALNQRCSEVKGNQLKKAAEIRELEKRITSIQPTVDGINGLLRRFGFQGFSLAQASNGVSYKLIRPDGTDAKSTLSEGEKTFVTFLYFYHRLKGSASESGTLTNRVVVFDDPVSSLDSDILYVVGSLIKGLFEEVRAKTGHIKQVFVFTHNIFFHKEVTFTSRREQRSPNSETFWIVRRVGLDSILDKFEYNPIKTSYELLWQEVRNSNRSKLTIQNTLRRILENYFKILGGVDPDKICELFEGKEMLICKSLFSWINDGSHYAHDDLHVSMNDSAIDAYLAVFKDIFEKSGHRGHYEMMIGTGEL